MGLIPARAGTTFVTPHAPSESGAHPRSRGDHVGEFRAGGFVAGSSPLARGPLVLGNHLVDGVGLIPARAGTTARRGGGSVCARAHPRSRGDHGLFAPATNFIKGSSPLARGPQPRNSASGVESGLIPARAGTTTFSCSLSFCSWAHPRSRGDHGELCGEVLSGEGSSPLARGPPMIFT